MLTALRLQLILFSFILIGMTGFLTHSRQQEASPTLLVEKHSASTRAYDSYLHMTLDGRILDIFTSAKTGIFLTQTPNQEWLIFYNQETSEIYKIRSDGSDIVTILEGNENITRINFLRWSHDGKIGYAIVVRENRLYLYEINQEGNIVRRVSFGDVKLDWNRIELSPNEQWLYSSDAVASIDGSVYYNLGDVQLKNVLVSPSPLMLRRWYGDTDEILVSQASSNGMQSLFKMSLTSYDMQFILREDNTRFIRVSNDGEWIYYLKTEYTWYQALPYSEEYYKKTREYFKNDLLYRIRIDGTDAQPVLPYWKEYFVERFSPNTNWIFFSTRNSNYGVNLTTLEVKPNSSCPVVHDIDFDGFGWSDYTSPDGRYLTVRCIYQIFSIDLETLQSYQLTDYNIWSNGVAGWSPDSQWVIFYSSQDDPSLQTMDDVVDLYRIHPDGSGYMKLTDSTGLFGLLGWLPPIDYSWHSLHLLMLGGGILFFTILLFTLPSMGKSLHRFSQRVMLFLA